jgi:hypothetical protein
MNMEEMEKMIDWLIYLLGKKCADLQMVRDEYNMMKYELEKLRIEVKNGAAK